MANVLLGATGSVAAVRVPVLVEQLQAAGHAVRVVATKSATYFFDPTPLRDVLVLDSDEWPGDRYQRGDPVLHIELRRWADVLLVAPLDANTLAKFALGMTDNCLTCVYRAWDLAKPIVLAPAMNTLMWQHPATGRHIAQVKVDMGPELVVVPPQVKTLACDDVGVGAMAARDEILRAVSHSR